jgi:hypothetical protein
MSEIFTKHLAADLLPRSLPRKPTPAVWLATGVICLVCLWSLAVGIALLVVDWIVGGENVPDRMRSILSMARENGPHALIPPVFDPSLERLLYILLAALIGWCHYGAIFRRSALQSFVVAAFLLLTGLAGCLGHPFNLGWGVIDAAFLFSGIVMFRWGWRLAKPRPSEPLH